ncbi:MAG: radical SAM protein [bacterium]|nr:radical SAM protein [bacterium]
MGNKIQVREIECKTAIGKCGFPGGGWAINPYIGCGHNCLYCYGRFIKRFTQHLEPWGYFVDARINIAQVLKKQIKSPKFKSGQIYLGTVTDPYQPLEEKYKLSRQILEVLKDYPVSLSILTKSDLILRDLDLLKQFKNLDVNFTINSLDEKWKSCVEPESTSVEKRLEAAKKLSEEGIKVFAMMGPYFPNFTDPEKLFSEFKKAGISSVFTESFNTTGGNFTQVEEVLAKHYPSFLPTFAEILFNSKKFNEFYESERKKILSLSKKYNLPVTINFGQGHAARVI